MSGEPTDWFRIRHKDPFSDDAFSVFQASCAVYRAEIEAIITHWEALPVHKDIPRPTIQFFPPELSEDRRVMSLPVRVDNRTLGTRALLQYSATRQLHIYLPFPLVAQIEVGLTEPSPTDSDKWRNDWWNPHKDNTISWDEARKLLGMPPMRERPVRPRETVTIRPKNALAAWLCALLRKWGQ